jgi:hypothetical protein
MVSMPAVGRSGPRWRCSVAARFEAQSGQSDEYRPDRRSVLSLCAATRLRYGFVMRIEAKNPVHIALVDSRQRERCAAGAQWRLAGMTTSCAIASPATVK